MGCASAAPEVISAQIWPPTCSRSTHTHTPVQRTPAYKHRKATLQFVKGHEACLWSPAVMKPRACLAGCCLHLSRQQTCVRLAAKMLLLSLLLPLLPLLLLTCLSAAALSSRLKASVVLSSSSCPGTVWNPCGIGGGSGGGSGGKIVRPAGLTVQGT